MPAAESFSRYLADVQSHRHMGPENLVVLQLVESTNVLAHRIVDEFLREESPCPEVLLLAYEQLRGRGRQERRWLSPAGRGVYATLVVPMQNPDDLNRLPLVVGVGLARVLNRYLPGQVGLKWPNDLHVGGRKLGGILIETQSRGVSPTVAIVGFGINHSHSRQEISPFGATSLVLEEAAPQRLAALSFELVAGLREELRRLSDSAYVIRGYREMSVHRRGDTLHCRLRDETVVGSFLGFDERGFLRLRTGTQERRITAAEIFDGT